MGMFDYVRVPDDYTCPYCKHGGNFWGEFGFQSKDGACYMETVSYATVGNFYVRCPSCGMWLEYVKKEVDQPRHVPPMEFFNEHYELVRPHPWNHGKDSPETEKTDEDV